jgi:predicted NAD/FAD-binding protein
MKIAIIGAGVSGLTAAHYLHTEHQVVLFDADRRPGGHTNTVDVMEGVRPIPIDTGFIVFNEKTYPNFIRLLGELGVGWTESDMSFAVHSARRGFEYSGQSLSALFSQRRNLASPRFLRMVRDIQRFYREGRELLAEGSELPMLPWLRERGYSDGFIEDHLFPMLRAVWSANRDVAEQFPARFLARFFENHGFLQLSGAPRWLTIQGGSRSYVRAILAHFAGEVRLNAPVRAIRRTREGVLVSTDGSPPERFDHAIVTCHSDQALALLSDPSELERTLLSATAYQRNEAVLHTDASIMPSLRRTWSAWNVHLDDEGVDGACLTYWMNRLQPLGAERDYFVTLNKSAQIAPEHMLRVERYMHPVFTTESVKAQARHAELIDHRNTSYAGAYWRNGFHEDGVVSALRVVERLKVSPSLSHGAAA